MGGAPKIKAHLAGVIELGIVACTKVTKDVQAKAFLAIKRHNKKLKIASNSSNAEESKPISPSMSSDLSNYHFRDVQREGLQ